MGELTEKRGYAYVQKGEYDEAIADYTEAIRLDSKCAEAYHARGIASYHKGEKAKGDEDIAKARELGF